MKKSYVQTAESSLSRCPDRHRRRQPCAIGRLDFRERAGHSDESPAPISTASSTRNGSPPIRYHRIARAGARSISSPRRAWMRSTRSSKRQRRMRTRTKSGSNEQKIGWLYRSGMDEAAVDKAGFDPIKPDLAKIAALKTQRRYRRLSCAKDFAHGRGSVFRFGSRADYNDRQDADRFARPGRPRIADAGLLQQARVRRTAQGLRRAHRQDPAIDRRRRRRCAKAGRRRA